LLKSKNSENEMTIERGEMPTGKDRQSALEQPTPLTVEPVVLTNETYPPIRSTPTIIIMEKEMGRRFTVLDDFTSEETASDYVAGLSYEARDEDEKLLGLIDQWIKEGKVREGGPEAQMTGGDAEEDDK